MEAAASAGVKISFDVNFRGKLWRPQEASKTLDPLMKKSDIIFITREDAGDLFKIFGNPEEIANAVFERFNPEICIVTLGDEGGISFNGSRYLRCQAYDVDTIDRLGAGDCFTAGFLCGYLEGSIENGLKYASAMAALKLGIRGDYFLSNRKEVLDLTASCGGREVGR